MSLVYLEKGINLQKTLTNIGLFIDQIASWQAILAAIGEFYVIKTKGLNMFLIPINILNFCFSPSKIFLQFLVPIKFSITTFGPYF